MPGIGIVTNPNSRRNRRRPKEAQRLGYILGDHDEHTHALTQHPDDIFEVAERFRDSDIDILALNGGDGTNHVTLTTFIEVYGETPLPKIAFLRGGTMNTIANAVGVQGTPGSILLNLTEKYHLGKPFEISERDTLKIEIDGQTFYGFLFGTGLAYNFLEAYYGTGNPSPWAAFTTLMRSISGSFMDNSFAADLFRPFEGHVTVNGARWEETTYSSILAATIEQWGLGFRATYRCREQPGSFHMLGIRATLRSFAIELPRIRLGRPVSQEKILSKLGEEVVLDSDRPIGFSIDGDLHELKGPLRLTTGPRIKVIVK